MYFDFYCQILKPLREMSVLLEGEKYPKLCSLSRLVTTLNMVFEDEQPPASWNLGLLCSCTCGFCSTHDSQGAFFREKLLNYRDYK